VQIDLRDRLQQISSLEKDMRDTENDITRLESEKSKAQSRTRGLENELRVTKAQVEELLSTTLDNENVIRMKVFTPWSFLISGFTNCPASRDYAATQCRRIERQSRRL